MQVRAKTPNQFFKSIANFMTQLPDVGVLSHVTVGIKSRHLLIEVLQLALEECPSSLSPLFT
jgi:hypothetical protein